MTQPTVTDAGVFDYVASLALLGRVTTIAESDGAEAYKVNDDHLLILSCDCGQEHRGHDLLVQLLLPPSWVCFHRVVNLDDDWKGAHYGPAHHDDPALVS